MIWIDGPTSSRTAGGAWWRLPARVAACPSVLLLDEPAAGLGDHETEELGRLVRHLADEWGLAVLLVEHDVALVLRVCDRVTVLEEGRHLACGTPEEVRHDPRVVAAYLGEPAVAAGGAWASARQFVAWSL